MRLLLIFLLVDAIFWNNICHSMLHLNRKVTYMFHPSPAPTMILDSKSLIRCSHLCLKEGGGLFHYDASAGTCEIHDYAGKWSDLSDDGSTYYEPPLDWTSLTNVALGKQCYPPFHLTSNTCNRANDINNATSYHSKKTQPLHWWGVDLGQPYNIKAIDYYPHDDVPQYIDEVKVFVGSTLEMDGIFASYEEVSYCPGGWDGNRRIIFFLPKGTVAQYVTIKTFSTASNVFISIKDIQILV